MFQLTLRGCITGSLEKKGTAMNNYKLLGIALALPLLAGCSSSFTVQGTMTIPAVAWDGDGDESAKTKPGDACYFGKDGNRYPDVDSGAQVTLRDSTGATVGIGSLQNGGHLLGWSANGARLYSTSDSFVYDYCTFNFTIPNVDSGDQFFSIEVAGRGEVAYSRDDLEQGVSLSLGD